jgi:hypothetical protein
LFVDAARPQVEPDELKRLTESIRIPDRPLPLTEFERPFPGEATAIAHMIGISAATVLGNHREMKNTSLFANAVRDQHAKAHGCVHGFFVVRDDLPSEFISPLFRRGARYSSVIRFSNGRPTPQSDRKWDGRGMAIKLQGVTGTSILRSLSPQLVQQGEQDFVLSSFPVFFCRNITEYVEFMDAVNMRHDTLSEWFKWGKAWFWFILRHPRQFYIFIRTAMNRLSDPLCGTYHSMSPYLFGGYKVVRYMVTPTAQSRDGDGLSDNFLHDALVADLDPRAPNPRAGLLNFWVRVREAAIPDDVEDASLFWNRPHDQDVLLAQIEIPAQDFDTPHRSYACEHMAFNPWNCLPEHRPLGSLNRMRLAVYLASSQIRHKLNMINV